MVVLFDSKKEKKKAREVCDREKVNDKKPDLSETDSGLPHKINTFFIF